jgi:pimeloyl-ACP methyl ester carboxylesterase
VAYDHRGHGRSSGSPRTFTTDALADDLQAVLEAVLPDGEQAVLVGHSMGAMTIAAWAGRHPDEVSRRATSAVFLSTGVDRLSLDSTFIPLPPRLAPVQARLQGAVLGGYGPLVGSSSVLLTKWFSVSSLASPADVDACARMMRSTRPSSRARWARVMAELDLLDDLQHLTVPTTVVVGTADRITPPVYARRLAERLPSLVELVELPGVGHMTPIEAPDDVEDHIRKAVTSSASERTSA